MIIETAYLILILIALKSMLGLLLFRVLEALFFKESLLCLPRLETSVSNGVYSPFRLSLCNL